MGLLLQDDTNRKFSFDSGMSEIDEGTFAVVDFTGYDCISKPYRFDILLVAVTAVIETLDISMMLTQTATFTIDPDGDAPEAYHGIIYEFERLHSFNEFTFFRARLMPRLSLLMHMLETRVFLGKAINGLLVDILTDENGAAMFPYQTILNGNGYTHETDIPRDQSNGYPIYEYVCQYDESRLNFLSRWTEREGIYYYFTQDPVDGETVVFIDSHLNSPGLGSIGYSSTAANKQHIRVFTSRYRQLPARVELKDYSYGKAYIDSNQNIIHANIEGSAVVDPYGHGKVYRYGDNLLSITDAGRLANLRAQELLCRKIQYFGESGIPTLRAGYFYQQDDLDNPDIPTQDYLITEVTHEGNQTGYLTAGIVGGIPDSEHNKRGGRSGSTVYRNTYTALRKEIQFRPEATTGKPKITGTINAFADADKGNIFADIDSMGRYKVRMPFDTKITPYFVRMIQSHGGIPLPNNKQYGAHFPLHRGTEVQLAFVNGDPDRPIITGAVPNMESPSPVTDQNLTQSIIRDRAGNEIIMNSTPGDEYIRLYSPNNKSTFQFGKAGVETYTEEDSKTWTRGNTSEFATGATIEGFMGAKGEIDIGFLAELKLAMEYAISVTGSHSVDFGYKWEYSKGPARAISDDDINSISHDRNIVSATNDLCLIGGAGVVAHNDNTSIINANEAGIVLSVGEKQTPYEPGLSAGANWLCIGAAIAAVVAAAAMIGASEAESGDDQVGEGFGIGISTTASLVSVLLAGLYARKLAKDSNRVELVSHNTPNSVIEMNKNKIHLKKFTTNAVPEMVSELNMRDDGSILMKSTANNIDVGVDLGEHNKRLMINRNEGAFIEYRVNEQTHGRIGVKQGSSEIEINNKYPGAGGPVTISSNNNVNITSGAQCLISADGDCIINGLSMNFCRGAIMIRR